ncbi:MAG: hypothetical protein RLZZ505_3047 [Verrucomicrobiota bacterium]|jgi:hypothetical protein
MQRYAAIFLISSALAAEPDFVLQPSDAKLTSPAVTEASGLAASPSADGFLWMINDSGGTPEIHLAQTDGTSRGSVTVGDTKNIDWEDLAAFQSEGKPYLLIADTGDNGSARKSVTLHIVREPKLPVDGETLSEKVQVAFKIEFTYEDGPRDCESVAVDAENGKVILISKRTDPPCVYELPLKPSENAIARKIGTTATKAPGIVSIRFANQPTGLDISACHRSATVVTYHGLFLFRRMEKESWAEVFAKTPEALAPHKLQQAEAVAFSRDGKSIFAVSEKANSPVVRYGSPD